MPANGSEIYSVIVIGAVLGAVLVGFLVSTVFLYQKKKQQQEQEILRMKEEFEQESLRSQLEIQEGTLRNIAQELHDNIGQVLSVVKLTLAILPIEKQHPAFEAISNTRQIMNKAIFDLADLTKGLHTDRIAQIGLVPAIQFEVESFRKAGLLALHLDITGEEHDFDERKSIFLFRMFQEVVNNILKHSRAKEAFIAINYSDDNIFTLSVTDNGIGFDPKEKRGDASSSKGVGLSSMTNRAKLIGASFDIQSQPGKGTKVTIKLPLSNES